MFILFLILIAVGIYSFVGGKRVLSVFIFFFFLTDGFQLIPEDWFKTPVVITKALDYCFIYTIIIFTYGCLNYKAFICRKDRVYQFMALFIGFLLVSVIVNRYIYYVEWSDIIRTTRYYFIILVYFPFLRLTNIEIGKVKRTLFIIVLFQCILFISQIFLNTPLLTGYIGGGKVPGLEITRFYNIPILLPYFVFYAIYSNPFNGSLRWISIILTLTTILLPMHRGWIIAILLLLLLNPFLTGTIRKSVKYLLIGVICLLPLLNIFISRFETGGTNSDIGRVFQGDYIDYSHWDLSVGDATMLYRVALLYERVQYILEEKVRICFGIGHMSEGSSYTESNLDFKIGIINKEESITQVDTGDIAWVNLLVRFGFLGTIIYLLFYLSIVLFFLRRRKDKGVITPLSYLLLLLIISINSSHLYYMWLLPIAFLDVAIYKREEPQLLNPHLHKTS